MARGKNAEAFGGGGGGQNSRAGASFPGDVGFAALEERITNHSFAVILGIGAGALRNAAIGLFTVTGTICQLPESPTKRGWANRR